MGVPYIAGIHQFLEADYVSATNFSCQSDSIQLGNIGSALSLFGKAKSTQQTLAEETVSSVVSAMRAYGFIK